MQFSKINFSALASAAVLVAAVQTHAMIVNGSFENPALSANSWVVLGADDTSLVGWTHEAPASVSLHINGHGPGGAATVLGPQDGTQFLELDGGNAGAPVYVEQTLTGLAIGVQYNVIGYYGWPHRAGAEHGRFKVELVGVGDLLAETLVNNDQQWTQFNLPFTATATSHTVRFVSRGTNYGQQVALDNISVVPEPALAGLATLGLVIGLARRVRGAQR